MSKIMNPKLSITSYFEFLIRHIDIFTEQTLANHHTDEDVFHAQLINPHIPLHPDSPHNLQNPTQFGCSSQDDYRSFDFFDHFNHNECLALNLCGYLNRKREELIKELVIAQKDTLDNYDKNRSRVANFAEEIESILFEKHFYFIITKKEKNGRKWKNPFRIYLVKLDFYLNSSQRDFLRFFIDLDINFTKIINSSVSFLDVVWKKPR